MPSDGRIRRKALGFQALTVSSSAVAPTIPAGTDYVIARCETANVRWRDDGTAPTAGVGFLLQVGETLNYDAHGGELQFIRTGGTDGSVTFSYYG